MAEARGRDKLWTRAVKAVRYTPAGVRRSLHTLALVLAGCLPEAPPPWQVDHTIAAALRFEVVERGPWAADPPREDRKVAEVMPGDTLRPVPFVVGVDGPALDLKPRYFFCDAQECLSEVGQVGGVRDCGDDEVVPPVDACELRGGTLRLGELTALLHSAAIFMVAGTPEGPSTYKCLKRMRGEDGGNEALQGCLLRIELLQLGPTWRLFLLAALTGLPDAVPLTAITPAVTAGEPNLFPGEPALTVYVTEPGQAMRTLTPARGDVVTVRRAAQVVITAEVDPDDAQEYWFVSGTDGFAAANEVLTIGWLFTQHVEWTAPDLLTIAWTAPDQSGPLYVYGLLGDGSTITPTWLRFEVEG